MSDLFKANACDRCGKPFGYNYRTLSFMNMDVICLPCRNEEKKHPHYQEAVNAELAEVKKGNTNYEGLFAGQKYPFEEEM